MGADWRRSWLAPVPPMPSSPARAPAVPARAASTGARLRRRLAPLLVAVGAVSAAGCGALLGRAPDDRITLDLPVSRTVAVRRTLAAFRRQGYTVRETLTSASHPETQPFEQEGPEGRAEVVFQAEVSGSDRAARVVLSGRYHRIRLRGAVRERERPVRATDDALERVLWNRLDNLALVIRRPAP